jgi:putative FmdB family regulatory protein
MPTYDYVCDACGHRFEEFQNITATVLTKCPACKKKKLRRLFGTGAAIVFKGSGFYQTDYRSEGYKKAQAADGTGSSDGGSSSGSGGGSGSETAGGTSSGTSSSGTSGSGGSAKSTAKSTEAGKSSRKSTGKSDNA